ncbi:type VII secretion integral membrane protein EccD [Micromonospora sp. NBC_00858]|uniref:type VII secretion integral membrane protein EccD n=1 Tax=Micromonospora sp. NBC_00858 TaxID=2975979 RepID=UPI003867B6EE|nr:type VII secretion integral membrane protein EccD [Micromonospora sp. NBC_00858]
MSTALNGALCRITVIGPDRRVDLAVPSTTPVAQLLPVLLRHTTAGGRSPGGDIPEGAWVLQRLGQSPFELTGTPESLEWLEGEELYLRVAEDPLPELDFDDLAEGVATVVNRRNDRWQPEYRRILFLILSVVGMGTIAAVLVDRGPVAPRVIAAAVLATSFLAVALVSARRLTDGAFALLFGLGSAAFAAVAWSSAVDGDPEGVALTGPAVLFGSVAVVCVVAVLLLAQRTVIPRMPFAPFLVLGVTALMVLGVLLLQVGSGLTAEQTSAVAVSVVFALVVAAPRGVVKLSRLRGPQLPKTGEDMSYDIEPALADEVKGQANDADTYLTVVMLSAAVLVPVLFWFTMRVPGWAGWTLVFVLASAILLRARTFFGIWQRVSLTVAGTVGYLMVVMKLSDMLPSAWRYALLGGLLALLVPLVLAALRPWPQRLLPFWEYSATFFDVATAVAVLPVLAQVVGLYAWARGLFG